ncbi:MAG: hypothetical protein AAB316_01850 [Bacteroidota bacterium]
MNDMNLPAYPPAETLDEVFDEFFTAFFSRNMPCLASDLLKDGFQEPEIVESVRRAMSVLNSAGMDARRHFQLVSTVQEGLEIRDCKLTALGYALVLMNGPADNAVVGDWQLQLIQQFLGKREG